LAVRTAGIRPNIIRTATRNAPRRALVVVMRGRVSSQPKRADPPMPPTGAPSFPPVVHRGVPLHQLSPATPAWPPLVHLLHLAPLPPPQTGGYHPLPQRHLAHLQRVSSGQAFTRQGHFYLAETGRYHFRATKWGLALAHFSLISIIIVGF
jgi:hypothetical protein